MKKIKIDGKLDLEKMTVAKLHDEETLSAGGGIAGPPNSKGVFCFSIRHSCTEIPWCHDY